MSTLEQLLRLVRAAVPDVRHELDQPNPKGAGFLNLWTADKPRREHEVVVQYRPKHGFGITADPNEEGFGMGPHEVYATLVEAAGRAQMLLSSHSMTQPPRGVQLRELRARVAKLTQEELADRLDVSQSAIAHLEQRADTSVSTLRKVIEAMGGELEITAKFPDRRVVLSLDEVA